MAFEDFQQMEVLFGEQKTVNVADCHSNRKPLYKAALVILNVQHGSCPPRHCENDGLFRRTPSVELVVDGERHGWQGGRMETLKANLHE